MFQPDTLAGNERGAALIEFAFAAPILLSLVLGAVQAGVMLQANSQVKQAIGEAGRAAVVAYQDTSDGVLTAAEVKALVIKEATTKGGLDSRKLSVTTTIADDETVLTKIITVNLTYGVDLVIPFVDNRTISLTESRRFYAPL